jgi:hypothetical protein
VLSQIIYTYITYKTQSAAIPGTESLALEGIELRPFCACRLVHRAGIAMLWDFGSLVPYLYNFVPGALCLYLYLCGSSYHLPCPISCGSSYRISIIIRRAIHTADERRIHTTVTNTGAGGLPCAYSHIAGPGLQNSSRVINNSPPPSPFPSLSDFSKHRMHKCRPVCCLFSLKARFGYKTFYFTRKSSYSPD